MIVLSRNYINISYQGIYEVIPDKGFTVDNTFQHINNIIHSWVRRKFADKRIPRNPKSWNWSGGSRSIDIYRDYDKRLYCVKVTHADEEVVNRMWTVEASVTVRDNRVFLASRTLYTAENREFRKPLMINALIFKAIFSLCKSTQITVQSGPNHTVIKC